jgi:hypothetical protein
VDGDEVRVLPRSRAVVLVFGQRLERQRGSLKAEATTVLDEYVKSDTTFLVAVFLYSDMIHLRRCYIVVANSAVWQQYAV